VTEKRNKTINEIKADYKKNGIYQVTRADQRNVLLIGRTRTGKSTIKSLLVDPTVVPDDLTLKSGTKDPLFESFHIGDNSIVLNIIDTPGLFEHGNTEIDPRDNQKILNTIEICANREITKFHVVCFCVAITIGINQEDIESLKLLVNFLGKEISKNSCLIVTRCESKDEKQRENMRNELLEDNYFKEIAPFFELGIFFSGSINRDDFNKGNDSVYDQFFTISDYRVKLIELFTSDIEPFPISEMLISNIRRARDSESIKDNELQHFQARAEEQSRIIEELHLARQNDRRDTKELLNRLRLLHIHEREEYVRLRARQSSSDCIIS
jgi:GTP-binding protein EngB required for normal cell division